MFNRIRNLIDSIVYWYHTKTLWKRFGLYKCEICSRLTPIQYEIGLGYWTCNNVECMDEAQRRHELDIEEWRKRNGKHNHGLDPPNEPYTTDSSVKQVIEYE